MFLGVPLVARPCGMFPYAIQGSHVLLQQEPKKILQEARN